MVYDAVGRKSVPFDGRRFQASSASTFRIGANGSGNRVIFAWSLRGQADGTVATGRLYIAGVRIVDGRRQRCRPKPRRRFQTRLTGQAPTGAPQPPARAAFGGLSDIQVGGNGLRAPVIVKISGDAAKPPPAGPRPPPATADRGCCSSTTRRPRASAPTAASASPSASGSATRTA